MYDNDFRLKFYIGDLWDKKILSEDEKKMFVNINTLHLINNHNRSGYKKTLKKLLNETGNNDKNFSICFNDNSSKRNSITILKNRYGRDEKSGVLFRSFEALRHWGLVYKKTKELSFERKKNKVIWRGATTGNPNHLANRFTFVKTWYKKNKNIDIGFTKIVQNRKDYSKYRANYLLPVHMLRYKYIVSINGNDKDSGLNWKLNSNSVVFMAKPIVTSWLMETLLIPNYHYIELKDDFSDLYEKYIWCEKNPDKCKEIIKNANNFMKMFYDKINERKLEQKVIKKYFEIIDKIL